MAALKRARCVGVNSLVETSNHEESNEGGFIHSFRKFWWLSQAKFILSVHIVCTELISFVSLKIPFMYLDFGERLLCSGAGCDVLSWCHALLWLTWQNSSCLTDNFQGRYSFCKLSMVGYLMTLSTLKLILCVNCQSDMNLDSWKHRTYI
jgi:hypothetical protein